MKKSEKHPALMEAEAVKIICSPLMHLNISYFCHVRIDGEGRFSAISNNPQFHEHYIENRYYNADIHLATREDMGKYIVWDSLSCDGESEKMNREAEAFGVRHTFTITERNGKNRDYYHFSTQLQNPSINHVYLENLDLLKLFILSFQEKTSQSGILSKAHSFKYAIEQDVSEFTLNNSITNRREFLEGMRLSLPGVSPEISQRELEILTWLHHGKTQAQIAEIIGIQEITVKKHMENLKEKTACYTQFQLGEYFAFLLG